MFEAIEKAVKQLQIAQAAAVKSLDVAAIEALVLVFELMLSQEDEQTAALDADARQIIDEALVEADFDKLSVADRRQVLQLILVATMREDGLQANYQLTPDAIGMWVAFLAGQFLPDKQSATVLDIAVGTGNQLATVAQVLGQQDIAVTAKGIENDDTLITLASAMSALLDVDFQLDFADAVATDVTADADVVVGDLPVGFYPQAVADSFVTKVTEDDQLTYVHHLLVERAVSALRPGGMAILLVPANLFESEQAANMLQFLQSDQVFFQAFIQFPDKLFANPKAAKAMLLLQKVGGDAKQAEPVMLAKAPEVGNQAESRNFITEMTAWMTANGMVHG